MGVVKLELPCPQIVDGISADPELDWSFDTLLKELNALENNLTSSKIPVPFTKVQQSRQFSNGKKNFERSSRPFVMRVLDDEVDNIKSEDEEPRDRSSSSVKRFNFDHIYLSDDDDDDDDSEDELALDAQPYLMEESGLVEGGLMELTYEHQLGVKGEIRNKMSALESDLLSEKEKFASALLQVEKDREARRETDRKLDTQYQRKIAEALDNHLTTIQRNHERRSQIEERKIRSDAAFEFAMRKDKALKAEELRQEKARVEAEAKLKAEEEERAASMEAQKKAAEEAIKNEAIKDSNRARVVQEEAPRLQTNAESELRKTNKSASAGDITKAAESALKLEQERLKMLKDLDEANKALGLNVNKDYTRHERNISKLIRQITGTRDVVSEKAAELVKIIKNPNFPQSISIGAFARKVVSYSENPGSAAFACGYVIVRVTAEVPHLMDLILAELHRSCIYTVPKHIVYTQLAFESKEAYKKIIGFREVEGKIEKDEDYVKRLESYMKLYGALVQTEIDGFQNIHGLKEGWAWIARFLNTLPANRYTAVALSAFLRMAGYALFKRYKSQFRKILIISENFLNALRSRKDQELNPVIAEIQSYIEDNKFLQEPEGRSLETSLLSSVMVPEVEYQNSYYRNSYHRSDYYY